MSKGVNVENYPGVAEASGGDIIRGMRKQALKFAATFEEGSRCRSTCRAAPLSSRPTTPSSPPTPSSSRRAPTRGGWACRARRTSRAAASRAARRSAFLYSGKPVVVVGGGDTAMEDALVLARASSSVTLVHRRDTFRASRVLQQAVLSNAKITVMWNTTVKEFKSAGEGADVLSSVVVASVDDPANTTELAAEAAFVAIGHIPNTWLFKGQLEMTDNDYLVTRSGSTHCSVPGVFAAGDVADWVYRQAVTSAGSGSQAALPDAERWLSEQMMSSSADDVEDDAAEECHPEDYEAWTMKQIRKELKERGVDTAAECRGCNEKSQFIEVLCKHM